jgi:ornithine cyclodeaminase/alanine dehydrogenase-like protein (mu-crystallin family)
MADAIDTLERTAFAAAAGQVAYAERSNLMLPNGWMRMAPAALLDEGVVGYKEFHLARPSGIRFSIWLYDLETGAPLAFVDGNHITAIRTGASGGLAVRCLSNDDASIVAVIGSSETAYRQLEAAAAVRSLRDVRVFSPTPQNRDRFALRARDELRVAVRSVGDVAEALDGAEVLLISTDTKGNGPALGPEIVRAGLHINSIGSTLPDQRELHHDVWRHVDVIAVDTVGVLHDSGDVLAARDAGTFDESVVRKLDEIVAGVAKGRTSAEQVTLYKSVGTSAQDVATALYVYREALRLGEGVELPDLISVKDD